MRTRTHRGLSLHPLIRLIAISGAAVVALANPVRAQSQGRTGPHITIPTIPARSEDVETVDAIVRASYETISGPAGQARQWGRDRTLYASQAYFVETGTDSKTGKAFAHYLD